MQEATRLFSERTYEEAFLWIREKIETYPDCKMLILNLAGLVDAQRLVNDVPQSEKYDEFILDCYERVLESEDQKVKRCAAALLTAYCMRKDEYEKAQKYLAYYAEQDPERKIWQAQIYEKTGKRNEAYRAYEELLFSGYQILSLVFHNIFMLAMEEQDMDKAQKMAAKQQETASLEKMKKL